MGSLYLVILSKPGSASCQEWNIHLGYLRGVLKAGLGHGEADHQLQISGH